MKKYSSRIYVQNQAFFFNDNGTAGNNLKMTQNLMITNLSATHLI